MKAFGRADKTALSVFIPGVDNGKVAKRLSGAFFLEFAAAHYMVIKGNRRDVRRIAGVRLRFFWLFVGTVVPAAGKAGHIREFSEFCMTLPYDLVVVGQVVERQKIVYRAV